MQMKTRIAHMNFKNGCDRIQIVHYNKPIQYGLGGMATSKLFRENVALVIRPDLLSKQVLFASLAQCADGSAPRVEMKPSIFYGIKQGSKMARFIMLHELGHYINNDLLMENMAKYDEERGNLASDGCVADAELCADAFAASYLGRDASVAALLELKQHLSRFYDENAEYAENADLVLSEIDLRIAAL